MIYDHLRSETGQSHLEAEVSAVRPLSKGQTPLCQALPAGYNDDDDYGYDDDDDDEVMVVVKEMQMLIETKKIEHLST